MTGTSEWDAVFDGEPLRASNQIRRRRRTRKEKLLDERSAGKRLDIQGLRMVAVVAVVINHLTNHPQGGFVGVDVFFVISGYLITGHLVRDLGRGTGPGDYLVGFYRRRIRRLFPAALLVIVLTIVAAHAVFNPVRYHTTWHDGLWAAIFGANWHYIALSTNYFTAGLPPSPFQHYWSLSVEEQFYVFWPIVLFAVVALFSRGERASAGRRRLIGGIAAGVLSIVSLVIAFLQSSSEPSVAYFSTFTRGWELGLGALLACTVPYLRAPARVLTAMSWVGMAVIGVSLFVVHGGSGFPAPGAILPCVGAALVIAAVTSTARAKNVVLTNRASVFVGDISYSVYLVHFPVIVLLSAGMGEQDAYFYVAAPFLTLALSIASYALVERPVLNSGWLLPRNTPRGTAAVDDPARTSRMALAAGCALVIGLATLAVWPGTVSANDRLLQRIAQAVSHTSAPAPQPAGQSGGPSASPGSATPTQPQLPTPVLDALQKQLGVAAQAEQWPTLSPSIDTVIGGQDAPADIHNCGRGAYESASECTFGSSSATHTFYLVGDSTSMSYAAAFIRMVETSLPDWNVRVGGGYGCKFADKVIADEGALTTKLKTQCEDRLRATVAAVRQTKPDVVVLTNSTGKHVADYAGGLREFASSVGKIVILPAAPQAVNTRQCYKPSGSPTDCVAQVSKDYMGWMQNEQGLAAQFHGVFIPTQQWFCAETFCPAFAGSTPMMYDSGHVCEPYAQKLAPVLLEALRNAKVVTQQ